jgi:hypothetical protein
METLYRVHQFAELAGVTVKALRHYDRLGEALWERWEAERLERERSGAPAPPRVSESQRRLFREWSAILGSDPSSPEAQALVAQLFLRDRSTAFSGTTIHEDA